MSRIGKLPIKVPKQVNIEIKKNLIQVVGPEGNLTLKIPKEINITFTNRLITVEKIEETNLASEKYGLIRSLLNNMISGVMYKFTKTLSMKGIGYNAHLFEKNIILNVGFTHPITFLIPDDLEISIEEQKIINIKGCNNEKVGLFTSKIRSIRPPEPYKGKGICHKDEIILRKDGKSGK